MSDKIRLCKLMSKEMSKDEFKYYKSLVINPIVICKKCGRAANSTEYLCKPKKLNKKS